MMIKLCKVNSFVIFLAVIVAIYFTFDLSITPVNALSSFSLSLGNNTIMSSDTFFQLDDSIESIKGLVNNTSFAIDRGNITEAKNILNQIYGELIQISKNANNLIWDVSNRGN